AAFFDQRHAGTFELSRLFPLLENRQVLFETDGQSDPRNKDYLMFSSRVGLGDADARFRDLPLRTLVGRLSADFDFKEKTKVLRNYLLEHAQSADESMKLSKQLRSRP
ncbi:MAG TPA: hypothetical protein VIQ97_01160, partial [Prevotella sp.]